MNDGTTLINESLVNHERSGKIINIARLDENQPNLKSNHMNTMKNIFSDKYNLTHVRYLLSLNDNDLKINFNNKKKYKSEETKRYLKKVKKCLHLILEEGDIYSKKRYDQKGNNRLHTDSGSQLFERNIRNFIQHESIKDYDMINAQVQILLYLCKKSNLPCYHLEIYCKNREEILKSIGREKGKDAVNYSLFCDKPKKTKNIYIDNMIKEYINNRPMLIKEYQMCINEDKETNEKNPQGSNMSNILCYYENEILSKVIDTGYTINTLIYDGFLSEATIPIEELNRLTEEYGMKWKEKPLDTCYELPDDFDVNEIITYQEQKKKFENEVKFITFAETFKALDEVDNTWKGITAKGLSAKYKNWRTLNENGDDIDFLDKWLKDRKRKDYNTMLFHPYSLSKYGLIHEKQFNTFRGFKRKNLGRKIEDDEVKPFTDHLKMCFGYEKENGDQIVKILIKHIAHILQKPHKKIEGILVLRGYESTGKDTIKEIFNRLIGKDHVYETEGMNDVITKGNWNDHLIEKLVVVMNEVKSEDGIKNIEGLKHKATTKDLNVKEKYMKNQTMADLNNMIINSNNNCPVIISPTDRRYWLLITNEDLAKNKEYWNAFYKYLNNEDEMDKLFTWLLDEDQEVDDYDFENDRVITEAYKKLATKNISEAYLALYHFLQEHIKKEGNTTWIMKTSEFNSNCEAISKNVLERKHVINKIRIKDKMDDIPPKYMELKRMKQYYSCYCWIVDKPQQLIDRLIRLEFQYFDPSQVDFSLLHAEEILPHCALDN